MTTDFGKKWTDLTPGLTALGAPASMWVSRVFASNHDAGTAYVTKNGYTDDVMTAFVFRTTDYGRTWKKITDGLPDSPVNVVVEDFKNPRLLFAGNDLGVYVSLNGGESWEAMKANMPPAVVRDIIIHPRENDLIAGTYGRGAWVTDISALQQLTPETESKQMHLFDIEPKPQMNFSQQASWGNYQMMGDNHLNTRNEPNGLEIWYYFGEVPKDEAVITVFNEDRKQVFERKVKPAKGIGRFYWNTMQSRPGRYSVKLTCGTLSESRTGIVLEKWQWPVLNYRGE